MVIELRYAFQARWKLHKQRETAHYQARISIEGPARPLMTDVAPILTELKQLEGSDLSQKIGKSSLEAIALYVAEIVKKHLDSRDRLKTIKIVENDFFSVTLTGRYG